MISESRLARSETLTRVEIRQIDHVRSVVHDHCGEISVEAQGSRLLQANRLHPLAGLRVEDVEVGFGVY